MVFFCCWILFLFWIRFSCYLFSKLFLVVIGIWFVEIEFCVGRFWFFDFCELVVVRGFGGVGWVEV